MNASRFTALCLLAALMYAEPARGQQQTSIDQIARQQMRPRTNPKIKCRPGRREWVTQQYGTFHGRLTLVNKLSVTIRDDYGHKFRIFKRELSEADQKWVVDLQRHLRMRFAAYRRRRR